MHVGMRADSFDFALLQKRKLDSVGSYRNQPARLDAKVTHLTNRGERRCEGKGSATLAAKVAICSGSSKARREGCCS